MLARRVAPLVALVLVLAAGPVGARPDRTATSVDDLVHLNEIQVIGSHNSYKRMVSPAEQDVRRSFIGDAADQLAYQHEPLPVQFQSEKVRQIELDLFADSAGGLYADPLLRQVAGVGPYASDMNAPGIKVLHIQDVDYESTCRAFVTCLQQIKAWSDANPSHVPIAILLELKDTPLSFGSFTFTTPESWTTAAMDGLDAEIRSVMDPGDLITPDDVRGAHSTLEEAVTTDGWPTLAQSRGKVLFLMDNGDPYRTRYLSGHPGLAGRVVFTNANPGDADAAFVKRNDATDASIPGLVAAGYVVRTRADSDTEQARSGDTSLRDAALASGAQWVSTDYPVPGIAYGFTTSYVAQIPGGTVARCNPVNAPPGCVSDVLDTIYTPAPPPNEPTTTTTTTTEAAISSPSGPAAAEPVAASPAYTG